MNKFIIMGRTTQAPEIRYTQTGLALATFSFAVDRKYKRDGEPTADFFNCAAFGKTAETIEKYVTKGMKLLIEGEVQNNNYTDQSGVKHYGNRVIIDRMEFCERKSETQTPQLQDAASGRPATRPPQGRPPESRQPDSVQEELFMNLPAGIDEELPFS